MGTEIEVEIVSKQQIKPSSPTPHHLRHLQLSFLDEIQLPVSMPFVLFYPRNSSISNLQRSNILRASLSDALAIFYPLAGRVRGNSHVDCTDEGVLFAEARANCLLSNILENKYSYFQNYKFIPLKPDEGGDLAASFQVTFFKCGGYAISFAMSHKLGDALSQFIFLSSWAQVARENIKVEIPPFGTSTLFPPKKIPELVSLDQLKEKIAVRVFVFEASTTSALKAKYSFNGEKFSKVQALAAFVLSRLIAVTQAKDVNAKYVIHHAVNLRPRMVPPMAKGSFGNLSRIASVVADRDDLEKDTSCYRIAQKMKESIDNVNADFVEKLKRSEDHINFLKEIASRHSRPVKGEIVTYSFSSLCTFPVYDVDFGWGKPEWVAMGALFFKNLVIFLDAKDGESIEAWISLKEEDMAKFEVDAELLSHASSSQKGKLHNSKMEAQSRL